MKIKKLIVEVDFAHSAKEIVLRLYQLSNDQKQLLRVQDLCNLVQRIRLGRENDWCIDDVRFLKQLWPIISKPHILRTNLQVVKVSKRKFDLWLHLWQNTSDRFIEKGSQQFYNQDTVKGEIRFKLDCHGETSTLSAIVVSQTSRPISYCQLEQQTVGSETQYLFENQRFELQLPVKKEIIDQLFGEKNPEIPTDKIEEHLPTILQGRLDLLEGPSVRRIDETGQLKIRLVADGADILIAILVDSHAVQRLQAESIIPMKLNRNGRAFEIYSYSHENLPRIIEKMSTLPLQKSVNDFWKLDGVTDNVKRLYEFYADLHSTVPFEVDAGLEPLFKNQSMIEPTLIVQEGNGWLDVHVQCHKGSIPIETEDIQRALVNQQEIIRTRSGEWLRLDPADVKKLNRQMTECGFRFGLQRVTNLHSQKIVKAVERYSDVRIHASSKQIINRLRGYGNTDAPEYSSLLLKTLRTYQREGADFLSNRTGYDLGCILADDMGLGKTIQVLAYLVAYKISCKRAIQSLVVCPASVTSVWIREAEKFTPELKINLLQGPKDKRTSILHAAKDCDVIVVSYAMLRNDVSLLKKQRFDVVILDEAQQIKNPEADITRAVKSLSCKHRLALTGTPLENKVTDLWSIVDFLNPGYLGTLSQFKNTHTSGTEHRTLLSEKISPFLLRRLKSQVTPQLPPKMEETIYIPLSANQVRMYEGELAKARMKLAENGAIEILAALTRLRQICGHPQLLSTQNTPIRRETRLQDDLRSQSSKLEYLIERLTELKQEGHSALVFSQFTTMLDIIERTLEQQKIRTFKIVGETPVPRRTRIIDEFQGSRESAVFLLSLKAAGTGLTLTKADYVFIYDPWWNPAAENQAIDRTHRIGQDKPVIAYRLVASSTIEEKIMQLKEEKQQLFSQIIEGAPNLPPNLHIKDLITILGT